MSKIFLVGFMGVGKTTVGKHLAAYLGWEFIDLDTLISEQAGKTIAEIFAQEGEAYFRQLETTTLASLAPKTKTVVALGGGTFIKTANRTLIEEQGISLWLNCSLAEILTRLGNDTLRPLYQNPTQMATLLSERLPIYRQAQYTLVVSELSVGAIVIQIMDLLTPLTQLKIGGENSPTGNASVSLASY